MFKKILIANRGEIAVRVIRACKELGITSCAVYSESDKKSLHTLLADESYFIGSSQASDSYLNANKIINLAKKIKADAIHPGYGFFSENSEFISILEKQKISFIGPSSKSVKLMGSKTAARKLMQKNGVPIVPGTLDPIISVKEAQNVADKIGYPVLLKASAGGGGKGMRKVSEPEEFKNAFESTKREALKAFANDDIYIEKFIENPKHIEVQVVGDKKGNYTHLFERECSIQRRHQKIIEEAPSSFVDSETRNKITSAAIEAAKACNYFNAGTIEFLMDKNKNFYFLEMNTRLQVEHPVTELITGIDLVKEQISIAAGNKLSFNQNDLKIYGHAIECRIYAEDPFNNFLPSIGELKVYLEPAGPGVRVDSGFKAGSVIDIYYDPLISKLITWAPERKSAINKMKRALKEYRIGGVLNNISFLNSILSAKEFLGSTFDINFLSKENMDVLIKYCRKEESELSKAAAVFSALIKDNSLNNKIKNGKTSNGNKWLTQLYE